MDQTKNAEINKRARAAVPSQFSHIPGWGMDMPAERRVGSPKDGIFTPSENGCSWESPEQQKTDVKIFVSTERPGITPVFGTMQPPKGLSGAIRQFAYQYSEGKRRHWMGLMLADRVDVVESTVGDLFLHPAETMNGPRKVRKGTLLAVGAILAVGALALRRPKTLPSKALRSKKNKSAH